MIDFSECLEEVGLLVQGELVGGEQNVKVVLREVALLLPIYKKHQILQLKLADVVVEQSQDFAQSLCVDLATLAGVKLLKNSVDLSFIVVLQLFGAPFRDLLLVLLFLLLRLWRFGWNSTFFIEAC